MAYINIAQWSSDQVLEWLKGLDNAMYRYMESFSNNHVDGEKLLQMRSSSLEEELGIYCIGHQEIILEAVEHLRNFHYNLDKENLQFLALQVATASRSLYKQLEKNREKTTLDTDALLDITRTLAKIKPLICWLDRPPFKGQQQYLEIRKKMLTLALEMAISAQRDRFAHKPVDQIIQNAEILAKLSDYIIQVITDPMLLQPASLILVTLKKKESDLGFYVSPSFHGIYRVTDIKFNSPAHISGKIEEGDEVVQINYQTVVGWQHKKVLLQLHDSKPDVLLTMKKRPKHIKIYGQIYMKPYRLPSKKRSMAVRWGEQSSPILSRPLELLPSVKRNFRAVTPKPEPIPEDSVDAVQPITANSSSTAKDAHNSNIPHEDSDSDLLTPTAKMPDHELHLLFQTSRPFLQRRNTVCGDQSESFKYLSNVKFWQDRRDKSISMGFGMENAANSFPTQNLNQSQQPQGNLNGSMPDILTSTNSQRTIHEENNNNNNCDNKRPVIRATKSVRFDATVPQQVAEMTKTETQEKRKIELSAFDAIPFADESHMEVVQDLPPVVLNYSITDPNRGELVEAKNEALIQQKSHLTATAINKSKVKYDDTPPAIEPRKEQQIAPTPPPRPKKPIEMSPGAAATNAVPPVPPPKPQDSPSYLKAQNNFFSSSFTAPQPPPILSPRPPAPDPPKATGGGSESIIGIAEALELVTPIKQKSLTLKKKNSILAKRRKVAVKSLPHSDIQGHLYRRTKDKSGTSYWAKGYFVLADDALYCFRAKDAPKADFLVFLQGFTVSLASEIHSKPFAFKVYHALKTLYFAAETQEALNQWMDYLRRATMSQTVAAPSQQITDIKEIFTETESSGEDSEENENSSTAGGAAPSQPEVKHEKYHLGLGSLKKFNNPFSSKGSNGEKKNNDLPIPSAQFRSYKKVQGYAGLSPGNHFFPPDSSLNPGSFSTPLSTPGIETAGPSTAGQTTIITGTDKYRPVISPITPNINFFPTSNSSMKSAQGGAANETKDKGEEKRFKEESRSPSKKFQPHNYMHASNPNLVDFELGHQLSHERPSQFSYETSGTSLLNGSVGGGGNGVTVNGNGGHSLQGCMTLMDLMMQQKADDAKEVYNNRVDLGTEKEDTQRKRQRQRNDSHKSENHVKITYGTSAGGGQGDQKIDKIQSRTLPKTPDYAQSFKPDDVDIVMIRSKEGQTLRNFGYEFISEEDPQEKTTGGSSTMVSSQQPLREKNRLATTGRKTDKISPTSWSRRKGLNWINTSDKQQQPSTNWEGTASSSSAGGGSFKKHKGLKFDSLKSTERFFSFNKIVGGGYDSKKSSSPGQSPSHFTGGGGTLPLTSGGGGKKGNLFNLTDGGMLGGTKKTVTPTASLDGRKLSSASTASYFSKLSFAGSGRSGTSSGGGAGGSTSGVVPAGVPVPGKEKKIFGSPRLHRAIFGKVQPQHHNSPGNRSPIFDEVILGQGTPSWMDTRRDSTSKVTTSNMPDVVGGAVAMSPGTSGKNVKTPEYPGMECPPVFRPETYSLADVSKSNTLRRRNELNSKKSA